MKLSNDQEALINRIKNEKARYNQAALELQVRQKMERNALKKNLYDLYQQGVTAGLPLRQIYLAMGFAQQNQLKTFFEVREWNEIILGKDLGELYKSLPEAEGQESSGREFELVIQGEHRISAGNTYYHLFHKDGKAYNVTAFHTGETGTRVTVYMPEDAYTEELAEYLLDWAGRDLEYTSIIRYDGESIND